MKKAGCQCPKYSVGLYCEKTESDLCTHTKCYENNCSMTFKRSSTSWPCAPCPKGTAEVMISTEQKCNGKFIIENDETSRDKQKWVLSSSFRIFFCFNFQKLHSLLFQKIYF